MRVTVLIEDQAAKPGLRTEHGLSLLVEYSGGRILLDAGQGRDTLVENMEALGLDPGDLDALVVSHGHYDHTGGIPALARRKKGLPVYGSPEMFRPSWKLEPGRPPREVGTPFSREELERAGASFRPVQGLAEVLPGAWAFGPIAGPWTRAMKGFFLDPEGRNPDPFRHEILFLLRQDEAGPALLFTGCCHRGVPNTLRAAAQALQGGRVGILLGGLHLRSAPPGEVEAAARALEGAGVESLWIGHCTGDSVVEDFARRPFFQVARLQAGGALEREGPGRAESWTGRPAPW